MDLNQNVNSSYYKISSPKNDFFNHIPTQNTQYHVNTGISESKSNEIVNTVLNPNFHNDVKPNYEVYTPSSSHINYKSPSSQAFIKSINSDIKGSVKILNSKYHNALETFKNLRELNFNYRFYMII